MAECALCPRDCRVDRDRGEIGYCHQTSELMVARASLHHWEEPCISGERGSGTVFFSGCALGCVYCQNQLIAQGLVGHKLSVEQLAEVFLTLQAAGAENINLVTASHFAPQVVSAVLSARQQGLKLPIVYNCGGYERLETLQLLAGIVDIYLPDLKYLDEQLAKRYSNCPDYFQVAKAAIAEMVRQVGRPQFDARGLLTHGVIVRHLALPGCLEDSKRIIEYLYETHRDRILVSIMNQFTPLAPLGQQYPELNRRLTEEEYDALVEHAIAIGISDGFIQEGDTASDSFIPDFHDPGLLTKILGDRQM